PRPDALDHDAPLPRLPRCRDRVPRARRACGVPRPARRALLRALSRGGCALEAARRLDVDRDDLHVRDHDRDRERDRRRRAAGAPLPLVRLPRRERRPTVGAAQTPDDGVLVFLPGALLIADSPNVNGARNDAITAKMIPIA